MLMDMKNISIPQTPRDAVINSLVAGLQLWAGSYVKRPTRKDREALRTAKANLAINLTPLVLPAVIAAAHDINATLSQLVAPQPQQLVFRPAATPYYRQPVRL
jgi:hypothetical protein